MKRMTIVLTVLLATAILPLYGRMQDDFQHRPGYYQYMVFRLTEDLALSEEQAERFFPLHRSYQDQKGQNHYQLALLSKEAYDKKDIGKADLEKYQQEERRLKLEELELDAAFCADLERFLSPEQVLRFMFFEHHFRDELSRELKERYHNMDQNNRQKNIENKKRR